MRVHIDIAAKVRAIKMEDLPTQCYPKPSATDELAKLAEKARRRDVRNPFPWLPMVVFLPRWASGVPSSEEGQGQPSGDNQAVSHVTQLAGMLRVGHFFCQAKLDMVKWVACYHAFALAASACGVMTYTAAMAHLRVCLQIAVSAGLDGRRHQLAQVYDIVARQEWAEKAERGRTCLWHFLTVSRRLPPSHCAPPSSWCRR